MEAYLDLPERPTPDAAIQVANNLLKQFRIPTKIVKVEDISSSLFVVLYESLFSDRLPNIIRQPVTKDDDIHNCQIVIDVLSNDVIHDSLSHIRGVDIVAGDLTAIFNLLDIFSHLLEYVINKIESDHDDTKSIRSVETNSQMSTPSKKAATSASSRRLPQGHIGPSQSHVSKTAAVTYGPERAAGLNKNENRKAYDDHKIISHEEFYAMTYGGLSKHSCVQPLSPIRPDRSHSVLGQKTVDSELDIDAEKVYDPIPSHAKVAWEDHQPATRDHQQNVVTAATPTHCHDRQSAAAATTATTSSAAATTTGFSKSVPAPSRTMTSDHEEPLRSTVGPVTFSTHPAPHQPTDDRAPEAESLSHYYRDLKKLVKKTAAMTRLALETSPVRSKLDKDVHVTHEPAVSYHSEDMRLAPEFDVKRLNPPNKVRLSPSSKKKVAFSTQSKVKGQDRTDPSDTESLSAQLTQKNIKSMPTQLTQKNIKSLQCLEQTRSFAQHLANNRQAELGAAHLLLKHEDLEIRKKHELLHKFYERDREEFAEDVDYILGRDHEKAAETEEKYVQKCTEAAHQKSGAHKTRGTSLQAARRKPKKKLVRHKVTDEETQDSPTATVALESEEDLLPFLMEEFPYLHLSEHTWHELWRKGLHQIEALTRAYQEIERKKSKAQNQLAEAAERHSMLSEIMRKQLEHSRRLQELREQKQQQVKMRNKTHEKRIQSARARRFYNEYQVRARAKVLKRRTKEEMVFRELFKDALNIQRERVKDIRKYASDQRRRQEQQRQNEIDSLENFYHNQFEMLAERLAQEHLETQLRDAAQNQMLERMKKELRNKMETEIKQYQEQIIRNDDDDAYFRQADADRLKQYLHTARYPVKI
ncbi:hypothetical protein BsWGS_20607 [Bradybaena similaris]